MPRNKRPQDRAEKRGEIIAAARELFLRDGYDATSMAALARAAGITPNTIYWYFADKDDVLLAVVGEIVGESWPEYQALASAPATDRLLWFVGRLQLARGLVTTIHARLHLSEALNTWHEHFHQATEGLLAQELLAGGLDPELVAAEVKISAFTIEGLITHELPEADQRAICASLARRWGS